MLTIAISFHQPQHLSLDPSTVMGGSQSPGHLAQVARPQRSIMSIIQRIRSAKTCSSQDVHFEAFQVQIIARATKQTLLLQHERFCLTQAISEYDDIIASKGPCGTNCESMSGPCKPFSSHEDSGPGVTTMVNGLP